MNLNGLPKQFHGLGIRMPQEQKRRRLVLAVEADTKTGKTRLLFTAPKPLLLLNLDRNSEGQEDEAIHEAEEGIYIYDVAMPDIIEQEKDKAQFVKCRKMVFDALETNYFRTVACDTGEALWELCRRGYIGGIDFGSAKNQADYAIPNGAMRRIFRAVRAQNDVSYITTQRLVDERETLNGKRTMNLTGNQTMAGWKSTRYETHCLVRLAKETDYVCDKPSCIGKKSRGCINPQLHQQNRYTCTITESQFSGEGTVLRGADITFQRIALAVHPKTIDSPEVWE